MKSVPGNHSNLRSRLGRHRQLRRWLTLRSIPTRTRRNPARPAMSVVGYGRRLPRKRGVPVISSLRGFIPAGAARSGCPRARRGEVTELVRSVDLRSDHQVRFERDRVHQSRPIHLGGNAGSDRTQVEQEQIAGADPRALPRDLPGHLVAVPWGARGPVDRGVRPGAIGVNNLVQPDWDAVVAGRIGLDAIDGKGSPTVQAEFNPRQLMPFSGALITWRSPLALRSRSRTPACRHRRTPAARPCRPPHGARGRRIGAR
jgi:hypothetical protein